MKVMIVTPEEGNFESLSVELFPDITLTHTATGVEAALGLLNPLSPPDCLVIDFAIGEEAARQLVNACGKRRPVLVGLADEPGLKPPPFDEWFHKPVDLDLLAIRIVQLVKRRGRIES